MDVMYQSVTILIVHCEHGMGCIGQSKPNSKQLHVISIKYAKTVETETFCCVMFAQPHHTKL
jgi:hypothetical protein